MSDEEIADLVAEIENEIKKGKKKILDIFKKEKKLNWRNYTNELERITNKEHFVKDMSGTFTTLCQEYDILDAVFENKIEKGKKKILKKLKKKKAFIWRNYKNELERITNKEQRKMKKFCRVMMRCFKDENEEPIQLDENEEVIQLDENEEVIQLDENEEPIQLDENEEVMQLD